MSSTIVQRLHQWSTFIVHNQNMKKTTAQVLADNLSHLISVTGYDPKEVAKRSGLSPRAVAYYIAGDRVPSIESAELLAKAFGLEGWHLIMPNLPRDLRKTKSLKDLVNNYLTSTDEGQKMITMIAEREATYKSKYK